MTSISIRRRDGTIKQIDLPPDTRKVDERLEAYVEILEQYLARARKFLPDSLGDDFASALFDLNYFVHEHVPEGIDPLP
jgi:hypothetical protein